jgi:hypothetical protein
VSFWDNGGAGLKGFRAAFFAQDSHGQKFIDGRLELLRQSQQNPVRYWHW